MAEVPAAGTCSGADPRLREGPSDAEDLVEDFIPRSQEVVLAYLREHGPCAGEELTDACKAVGLIPHDDRAFGSVFKMLARRGRIVTHGFCMRRKGHGTAGGRIWALPDDEPA